ncbi:MAG: phosphatase PAP2 family protein [Chloroflexi bacterium]|nr:phosphatase PAP2 family protein [Chloroflexota bacterium]
MLALPLTIAVVGAIGALSGRKRPFAAHEDVRALVSHGAHRSFPSRHVACAAVMATVALPAAPVVGNAMAALGAVLAVSRVYAGLHYPSDVLAGAALGTVVGLLVRRGDTNVNVD